MNNPGKMNDKEKRVAHTFKIRKSLLEEMQNAVAFYSGHPHYLSIGEFLENSLEAGLEELRQRASVELKEYKGAFPVPGDAKRSLSKSQRLVRDSIS